MARMVLEGGRLGCATEVIVIAAALSIQDPRERPVDKEAQADAAHARFAGEGSDFLALLRLWEYAARASSASCRAARSGGAARRSSCTCCASASGRTSSSSCAAPRARRRSPATSAPRSPRRSTARCWRGCCRTSACAIAGGREFTGARGARFVLWPGSELARRPPSWVVAAELVETSRLWGRTAAGHRSGMDRADRGPSRQAHLLRAALGPAPRRRRRHRARDAVRAADRRRAAPCRTGGSTRPWRASCSSAARWWSATGTRGTRSSPRTGGCCDEVAALEERLRRRDLARRRRGAVRVLRRARAGRRRVRAALRPLVARRAAHATRRCSRSRARCCSAPRPTSAGGPRRGSRASSCCR